MKVAVCLFSLAVLAGVVSTEQYSYAWTPGTEYVYSVRGRMMQGISVIDNQHAGFEVQYKLYVKLLSEGKLAIKPQDVEVVETEEQFNPREGDFEGKTAPLFPELKQAFESPILVNLRQGVVQSIQVQANLTETLINIKRAQVSQVIVDTVGANVVLKGNLHRQTNSVRRQDKDDDSGFFYETLEKTVFGECETYYSVSQTGPFQSAYQHEAQDQPAGQQSVEDSSTSAEEHPYGHLFKKSYKSYSNGGYAQSSEEDTDREVPWPRAYSEYCNQHDQVYEIYKVINFTACRNKPVLSYYSPSELIDCRPGDNTCGSLWNRAVVTRVLACGTSRYNYNILQVNQEEQFNFGLRDEQRIVSVGVNNITIESINKHGSSVQYTVPTGYKTVDLIYQFSRWEQQKQINGEGIPNSPITRGVYPYTHQQHRYEENVSQYGHQHTSYNHSYQQSHNQYGYPPLHEAPLRNLLIAPVTVSDVQDRVVELIQDSAKDIHDEKRSFAEQETVAKVVITGKALRLLSHNEIYEIYNNFTRSKPSSSASDDETFEYQTQLNFFYEALAIAGTNPPVTVLLKLIQDGHITGEKATQLVMTLPLYIRHPTPELRQQFYQFVKSPKVQESQQLKTTAILAFSMLLRQACVDARIKQTRYNVALYGEFCTVQDTTPFVEWLQQQVYQEMQKPGRYHWFNTYITALGNIGHPRLVQIVQKVLDESNDPAEKSKAIYALKYVINSQEAEDTADDDVNQVDRGVVEVVVDDAYVEKKVLPILTSVVFDKTEHPMVRVAAIQMFIYSEKTDVALWQQLAIMTWTEISQEVHSFIYSTLKNLAEVDTRLKPIHFEMVRKARAVLSLAKDFEEGYLKSRNVFQSDYVDDLHTGYFHQFSYFSDKDSIIPSNVYYKNYFQFGTGAFGVHPVEFSVQARTVAQIAEAVLNELDSSSSSSEESGEKNPVIKEMFNLLGVQKREMDENAHGSVYIAIREGIQRLFEVNVKDLQKTWKQYGPYYLAALRRGQKFNYQKIVELVHHTMEMPTMFGIPLTYEQRLPVMVSFVGQVKLQGSSSDMQVQAETEVLFSGRQTTSISVKVPYLGKKYESGVERHVIVNAPFRATARFANKRPVSFAITPTVDTTGPAGGKIELVTYHQRPYTAIITDELYPTVYYKGGQINIVRAEDDSPVYTSEQTVGKEFLGWAFHVNEKSDYREEEESVTGWQYFLQRFHSPSCYFNLGVYGSETIKYAQRQIVLDVDESSSKTLVFALAAKRGSGYLDGSWNTDSTSSSSSSSSESSSSSSSGSTSAQREGRGRYIHGSSSSSSSSESNESSDSHENSREVFNKARVVVFAILGKAKAIPPLKQISGVVNNLDEKTKTAVQYLAQVALRSNKFLVQFAAADAANHAAKALPTESQSLEILRNAVVNAENEPEQYDACVEVYAKYIAPPHANHKILTVLRETLLQKDLKVKINAHTRFGETCRKSDLKYKITFDGELFRSPEMTKYATKESPEAQICEEDEKKGFYVSDTCLEVANTQAAALNKARFTIKWPKELPPMFYNVTEQVEDFFTYFYYPQVSYNYYPEQHETSPDNTIIAEYVHTPDTLYSNLIVRRPDAVVAWNNVPNGPFVQAVLPFTATQYLEQNVWDYFAGNDSQPTCQFQDKYFSTFDNVVSKFKPEIATGCYHLLTADCSGNQTMAISAKNLGTQDIKLKIVLSGTKIYVGKPQPTAGGVTGLLQATQPKPLVVYVNDKPVQLPYTVVEKTQGQQSSDYIAKIREIPSGGIQIVTPTIDVAFDAEKIVIYGDETYRNVTCGMCGDFDGEKVADFRSPLDFPLSSASLLYASYAYPGKVETGETCHVEGQYKQKIQQEESLGRREYYHNLQKPYKWGRHEQHQGQYSPHTQQNGHYYPNQHTTRQVQPVRRQVLKTVGNQLCFTEKKYNVCPHGYNTPYQGKQREVQYVCVPYNTKVATQIQNSIQSGEQYTISHLQSSKSSSQQYFYQPHQIVEDPTYCY